jgi:hypothetical protein
MNGIDNGECAIADLIDEHNKKEVNLNDSK